MSLFITHRISSRRTNDGKSDINENQTAHKFHMPGASVYGSDVFSSSSWDRKRDPAAQLRLAMRATAPPAGLEGDTIGLTFDCIQHINKRLFLFWKENPYYWKWAWILEKSNMSY